MTFDSTILNSLLVSLGFIFLDFIFGVFLSIKKGTFNIDKLPQFISTNVLPYMGGLIILALFANYMNQFQAVFVFLTAMVDAKFGKEALIDKIKEWFA